MQLHAHGALWTGETGKRQQTQLARAVDEPVRWVYAVYCRKGRLGSGT
jgi:hypothetical protein